MKDDQTEIKRFNYKKYPKNLPHNNGIHPQVLGSILTSVISERFFLSVDRVKLRIKSLAAYFWCELTLPLCYVYV